MNRDEAAKPLGRSAHHVIDGRRVADVARHPLDVGAIGRSPVTRRDDGGARLAQHLNNGRADAGRGAVHEYPPAETTGV
jgi:hypothetical protein